MQDIASNAVGRSQGDARFTQVQTVDALAVEPDWFAKPIGKWNASILAKDPNFATDEECFLIFTDPPCDVPVDGQGSSCGKRGRVSS